jgi:hypothetical protein
MLLRQYAENPGINRDSAVKNARCVREPTVSAKPTFFPDIYAYSHSTDSFTNYARTSSASIVV